MQPGALQGAGLIVPHSQPAAFIKELITLPPTCVRLLEASTRVSLGPAAPLVVRCLHPMPVGAAAQSGCLRGGPWRLLSPGRWDLEQPEFHSQKQVFSGSHPVDLRGSQSPASLPAPPGAAGAPLPPKQGELSLCPPWPARCCLCPRR